jgi:hypothetical protein
MMVFGPAVVNFLEILRVNDFMGVPKRDVAMHLMGCGYSEWYVKGVIEEYCKNFKPIKWKEKKR